ncbi:MAG: ComEC/Rec2 family competence protein [Chloroflexi bacterium]|nr:ComEC/Rec2 family competence protein [Chloroflexota bacterium]
MALFMVAAGWMVGLALGRWYSLSLALLLLLLSLPALALLLARRQKPVLLGSLAVLGLLAGLLRVGVATLLPGGLPAEAYLGREVTVVGTLTADPVPRGALARVYVDLRRIRVDGLETLVRAGAVAWLELPASEAPAAGSGQAAATGSGQAGRALGPGDMVALTGRLEPPPSFPDFDYRASLLRRGITVALYRPRIEVLARAAGPARWLSQSREALARSLKRTLQEPQASLARALLLGQRDGLGPPLQEEWRRAGTIHILSISGLHVGVLLGVSLAAAVALLGRRRQAYLAMPFTAVWAYAILAGLAPPIQRAAAMGSLYLLAIGLGRQSSGGLALALTAAVLAGIEPSVLGQASFQLSFAAMAGLVYLAGPLREVLGRALGDGEPRGGLSGVVITGFAASLGATLAILPLLSYHFGMTSLVGLPATLLALPVLPLQLVTTALAALAGLVGGAPGLVIGWLAWPWLTYLLILSALFARLPFAAVSVGPLSAWGVLIAYAALAALLWRPLLGRPAGLLGPVVLGPALSEGAGGFPLGASALGLLLVLDASLWAAVLGAPSDRLLRVSVLDVGQGDAILVQAPGGRRILVDGGPEPLVLEQRLAQELPWWSRRLDLVVLTHPHADHVGGLVEVLERREVGAVLDPEIAAEGPLYAQWRGSLAGGHPPVVHAVTGTRIELGSGAWMELLHPPNQHLVSTPSDLDNNSVVLRLAYGRASFLLAGDIFATGESYLVARNAPLHATVLKVPHHGSANASTAAFLEAVSPTVAVVSVGAGNPFGHPSAETLQRLEKQVGEGRLFRTDQDGTVHLVTDGVRLWVEAESGWR